MAKGAEKKSRTECSKKSRTECSNWDTSDHLECRQGKESSIEAPEKHGNG